MPTWRLKNLHLDEVSLVPKGANRRRFTVFKSLEDDPMPDLKELIASLAEMDDEAKAKVRKALEMEPEDVFDKLTKATDEQKVALAKALGIEKVDEAGLMEKLLKTLGFSKPEPEVDKNVPEAVRKAMDDLKERAEKSEERAEKSDKKLDAALETIAKRDKAIRVESMVTKAAQYGAMGSADDISKLLTDIDEKLGEEGLKAVEGFLAKGEEAFKQAQVFDEIGRPSRGEGGDNAIAKIEVKALEIQKAATPNITIEEARVRAWRANPDIYKQHEAEKRRARTALEG